MADSTTCDCGAVYEVTYTKIMFRDKDTYQCAICDRTIDRWNGSRIPHHKLVSKPEKSADD